VYNYLTNIATNAKGKFQMSGKRLDSRDIHEAKRATEIYNSQVKRGMIDTSNRGSTRHVKCGCGVAGCVFISTLSRRTPEELAADARWLEHEARIAARKKMSEAELKADMGF
jgi:hypothetical protein